MRRTRHLLNSMTLIVALGAPSAGALAQDGRPKDGGADVKPIAPLQGPKVDDERAPGTDSRFSMGMERSRESERPIPLRVYEQELRKLGGAKADESVRLSMEQQQAIRTIIMEHRQELRAFYAEHREEISKIRAASQGGGEGKDASAPQGELQRRNGGQNKRPNQGQRPGQGQGDAPTMSDTPTGLGARRNPVGGDAPRGNFESLSPEARKKMQALRAQGPQESAAISRIWETLNEAQREHLSARFEAIRAEAMRKAEAKKLGDDAGAKGASDEQRAEMRERLESMSPEQRRALRERRRAGQTDAPERDD